MSEQMAKFSLDIGALGRGTVEVNGQDYSDEITGVEFQARIGQPPILTLHRMAVSGTIDGEGIVQVVSPSAEYDAQELVRFLSGIDPVMLEDEILKRAGFGDSTMTVALQILKEWASGVTSG